MASSGAVLKQVAEYAQEIILRMGYPGIFVLMVFESTMIPIPSTLVMPFAGFLASLGHFSLPLVILMNTLGAIVGSMACYWLGAAGGKPLLLRYGKYVLVKPSDLEKTEAFFAKYGGWTVFIARLLPVIRHFISIPAGIARMSIPKFLLQTVLGATLWGGTLTVIGYKVGQNWASVAGSMKRVDIVVGVSLILVVLFVAGRWYKKRRDVAKAAAALK